MRQTRRGAVVLTVMLVPAMTHFVVKGRAFAAEVDLRIKPGAPAVAADQDAAPSRAYVGHASDADVKAFLRQYPRAAGTRLDDCSTCHRGGLRGTDAEREFSPCSYCHLLPFPNSKYKTGVPKNYEDTLNVYGLAYKKAGRHRQALGSLDAEDSDGDGYRNGVEIADLRYPGDPASRPGQPLAPTVVFSREHLRKLPAYEQFMLMNTSKEPTDDYVTYKGVRILDLLKAAGVDLEGAGGITVFAPDGYSIDATVEDVIRPFPQGYYYSGPKAIADPERAFVKYPNRIPPGIQDGRKIPMIPWLLLAFGREGTPLDDSYYEKGTGRLAGEGPFRLVKPQRDLLGDPAKPGRPDRSLKTKSFGDGWDYSPAIDHNAGACVRGSCVIRINPMPPGFEEYDWKNGWPLIKEKRVVIFGRGVPAKTPVF
jgi:hypothetical protein